MILKRIWLLLNSIKDYLAKYNILIELLDRGIELIASELIRR